MIKRIIFVLWYCFTVFSFYSMFITQGIGNVLSYEQQQGLVLLSMVLDFPVGLIVWLILGPIFSGKAIEINWLYNCIIFICIKACSYYQWFHLFPKVFIKFFQDISSEDTNAK